MPGPRCFSFPGQLPQPTFRSEYLSWKRVQRGALGKFSIEGSKILFEIGEQGEKVMNVGTTTCPGLLLTAAVSLSAAPIHYIERVTICAVKANPVIYQNRVVAISGKYTSDRRHYSYLTDLTCGAQEEGIRVGRNASPAAEALWKKWASQCEARGDAALCVVEEEVCVVGEVRDGGDQGWLFDIHEIKVKEQDPHASFECEWSHLWAPMKN